MSKSIVKHFFFLLLHSHSTKKKLRERWQITLAVSLISAQTQREMLFSTFSCTITSGRIPEACLDGNKWYALWANERVWVTLNSIFKVIVKSDNGEFYTKTFTSDKYENIAATVAIDVGERGLTIISMWFVSTCFIDFDICEDNRKIYYRNIKHWNLRR